MNRKPDPKQTAMVRRILYLTALSLFAVGAFLLISPESARPVLGDDPMAARILGGAFLFIGGWDYILTRFMFGRTTRK